MRIPLLTALLGIGMVGCVGAVPGDPGSGDDTGSNTGSDTGSNTNPVPAVALSVDHTTVTSDLGLDNIITVTATGSMGFSGPVTLTATAVDSTGAALADWPVVIDNDALTLTADGTATAKVTVNLPGDVAALTGSIHIAASSTAAAVSTDVAFTANPTLDVTFVDNGTGTCVYSAAMKTINMKLTRTLQVFNGSTSNPALGMRVHSNASIQGFPHEAGSTPFGQAYVVTPTSAGNNGFYCHDNGAGDMLPGDGNTFPTLHVVP